MSGTFNLYTICDQRKRKMLFNIPPVRYTPLSPYDSGQYTKQQLDMRRKVEILSYNGNKTNTKTNNLTKSEKYALIVNGKYNIDKNNYNIINNISCPLDDLIHTPTSACDVPGPIMYLYKDPNVPLYNYSSNVDAYGIINTPLPTGWTIDQINDVPCSVNIDTIIASLCIQHNLDQQSYTYTINTPIAIYINGTTDISHNVTVTLNSINPTVWFSGQQVQYINPICHINGNLITNSLPSIDISLNHPSPSSSNTMYVYNAIVYKGMLTISNIVLSTEPGFIYDIHVRSMLSVVANTDPTNPLNYLSDNTPISPNYGIYCNLTNSVYSTLNNPPNKLNCDLPLNSNPTISITEFSLQGQ